MPTGVSSAKATNVRGRLSLFKCKFRLSIIIFFLTSGNEILPSSLHHISASADMKFCSSFKSFMVIDFYFVHS